MNDERSKKDRIQIDNESKNEHLKKLQKKLERLIRDQTAELESSESKTQSMSDNADDRMRSLGKNKEQYNILLESYPVVERENTNLRHVVNNLKEEVRVITTRSEATSEKSAVRNMLTYILTPPNPHSPHHHHSSQPSAPKIATP